MAAVVRRGLAISMQTFSIDGQAPSSKEAWVKLHHWKWVEEGHPTLDLFLVRSGKRLSCLVDNGGKQTISDLFQESSPEIENDLKTCEPVFEFNGSVTFVKPAIEWFGAKDGNILVRGLIGTTRMFWQIVKPDHKEYVSFAKTRADPSCSPLNSLLIHTLYELTPPEAKKKLSLLELVELKGKNEVVLQPIPLRSTFDFEVKTTAFTWGVTLISYTGCLLLCFEGIQNDHFFATWFPTLPLEPKGPFRLCFQPAGARPFTLFDQWPLFERRSAIQLIKAEEVKELLKAMILSPQEIPNEIHRSTRWDPKNLAAALTITP